MSPRVKLSKELLKEFNIIFGYNNEISALGGNFKTCFTFLDDCSFYYDLGPKQVFSLIKFCLEKNNISCEVDLKFSSFQNHPKFKQGYVCLEVVTRDGVVLDCFHIIKKGK